MKRPDSPFLEIAFYFGNTPEHEAFRCLIKQLLNIGAKFTGRASVHQGAEIKHKAFAAITDQPLPSQTEISDLEPAFVNPNMRIIQVLMEGATGITEGVAEIVTYLSISTEAAHTDKHPIAIWTDGWLFSGPFSHKHPEDARKVGKKVYERFQQLTKSLDPSYAAITTEVPLECPTDLREDPRSYAFRDFYVSNAFLGLSKIDKVNKFFESAYTEQVGNGLYVSTRQVFNPEGISLDVDDALAQSVKVAKLIAYGGGY